MCYKKNRKRERKRRGEGDETIAAINFFVTADWCDNIFIIMFHDQLAAILVTRKHFFNIF